MKVRLLNAFTRKSIVLSPLAYGVFVGGLLGLFFVGFCFWW